MAGVGRYLSVCIAWLTAGMTLVTGTPHVQCQCPSGNVKPFCLSMFRSDGGCCCDGSCCSPTPGAACCCQRQAQVGKQSELRVCCAQGRGGEHNRTGLRLGKASCVKHVEQDQLATEQGAAELAAVTASSLLSADVLPPLALSVPRTCSCVPVQLLAPPDDLTTRLLHLVI